MKSNFLKQSILTILVSVFTIFCFSSCNEDIEDRHNGTTNKIENNDNDNDDDKPIVNDNYYVKYTISTRSPYIFRDWSVTTPEGTYTKNDYQTRHWEQTYGPVKKGFVCKASASGVATIEIHVSKNQEPFALKATSTTGSATYTIDF